MTFGTRIESLQRMTSMGKDERFPPGRTRDTQRSKAVYSESTQSQVILLLLYMNQDIFEKKN